MSWGVNGGFEYSVGDPSTSNGGFGGDAGLLGEGGGDGIGLELIGGGGSGFIQNLDSFGGGDQVLQNVDPFQYDLPDVSTLGGYGGGVVVPADVGEVGGGGGSQQQRRNSFEKSLITLNDISNYRASGLDWMETGVSNWLNFDQGANFAVPEETTTSVRTPSVTTSSMYNFYDEEEDECGKDLLEMEAENKDFGVVVVRHSPEAVKSEAVEEDSVQDSDDVETEEEKEDSDDSSSKHSAANQHEKSKPTPKPPPREETCTLCNILFKTPGLYEKHMLTVHDETHPYACNWPSCTKKFARFYQRESHLRIHDPARYSGDPEWGCGHCDKAYHVRCSLYTHYKTSHPGVKVTPVKKVLPKTPIPRQKKLEIQQPGASITKQLRRLQRLASRKKSLEAPPTKQEVPEEAPPPTPEFLLSEESSLPLLPTDHSIASSCRPGHYPCRACGKVFTHATTLKTHVSLHTGEKPWACPHCPETFRLKQTLNYHLQRKHPTKLGPQNILKLLKCRVCGKDDFINFNSFRIHRTKKHAEVPYDEEKEKPFGCGVCLKPYFLREEAIICALVGHDPKQLQEAMFKYKCPNCPEENLGYHKMDLLRGHWEEEHVGEVMPLELKIRIGCDDLLEGLPEYKMSEERIQDIKENGLPRGTSFSSPLYFDLTEFGPSVREQHWIASLKLKTLAERGFLERDGRQVCTLCGEGLSNRGNLKRHLTTVHIDPEMQKEEKEAEEKGGDNVILNREQIKATPVTPLAAAAPSKDEVENIFQSVLSKKRRRLVLESEEEKISTEVTSFKCKFCDKVFNKKRALQFHEVRGHVNPKKQKTPPPPPKKGRRKEPPPPVVSSSSEEDSDEEDESSEEEETESSDEEEETRVTVNSKDLKAVRKLLGHKTLHIGLSRVSQATIRKWRRSSSSKPLSLPNRQSTSRRSSTSRSVTTPKGAKQKVTERLSTPTTPQPIKRSRGRPPKRKIHRSTRTPPTKRLSTSHSSTLPTSPPPDPPTIKSRPGPLCSKPSTSPPTHHSTPLQNGTSSKDEPPSQRSPSPTKSFTSTGSTSPTKLPPLFKNLLIAKNLLTFNPTSSPTRTPSTNQPEDIKREVKTEPVMQLESEEKPLTNGLHDHQPFSQPVKDPPKNGVVVNHDLSNPVKKMIS